MNSILFVERNGRDTELDGSSYSFHYAIRVVPPGEAVEVTAIRWRCGAETGIMWHTGSIESFEQLVGSGEPDDLNMLRQLLYEALEWHGYVVDVDQIPK